MSNQRFIMRHLLLAATALFPLVLAAQTQRVHITVVDDEGQPVVGANIYHTPTQRGATTDGQGQATLNVPQGSTLRVSCIGLLTRQAKVEGTQLRVQLKADNRLLEEAVVTGYQRVKSRVYTGAAQLVKLQDVKLEGVADLSRMLEGRVAGLSIQSISGSFGSAPRINIRGGVSIIGNAQPLWVIDGVVHEDIVNLSLDQLASGDAQTLISSAVAGLNAADIEDIQVLKDAAATSIYGARALNGVVVVSTKRGKREQPLQVGYNVELSLRPRPSYKDYDLLDSRETMGIYREMEGKGYFSLPTARYGRRGGVFYQMYKDIEDFRLLNTETARTAFLDERAAVNTDWFDHLFTLCPTAQHTLSISGGGQHSAIHASLG